MIPVFLYLPMSNKFADQLRSLSNLRSQLENVEQALPEELFQFVSSVTPLVNVDLLIQDSPIGKQRTLLTWREDDFYRGWHLPGGILRFKEDFASRLNLVAKHELQSSIKSTSSIVEVNEKINPSRDIRGHFISILFRVTLTEEPPLHFHCEHLEMPRHGQWAWHHTVPKDLLLQHEVYRKYFVE